MAKRDPIDCKANLTPDHIPNNGSNTFNGQALPPPLKARDILDRKTFMNFGEFLNFLKKPQIIKIAQTEPIDFLAKVFWTLKRKWFEIEPNDLKNLVEYLSAIPEISLEIQASEPWYRKTIADFLYSRTLDPHKKNEAETVLNGLFSNADSCANNLNLELTAA